LTERTAAIGTAGALVLAAAIAAALYLISAPLLMLFTAALRGPADLLPFEPGARWTFAHLEEVYTDPFLYRAVLPDTAVFVCGSVALAFVVAFVLAWLVERTDLPWRNGFYTLILFPLLVPSVILAISWILLFGPNAGWVNALLNRLLLREGAGPIDIFSMGGLIAAQSAVLVPFIFLLLTAVLRSMNTTLEEASSASGASPAATFFRVTLPVLRPGILAPLVLAALVALEQFDMPLILGLPARVNVFSIRILFELNPDTDLPAYGRAAALSLPFLFIGLLLLMLYNGLIRRAESYVTVTGTGYRPRRLLLGAWRWPAVGFVLTYVTFAAVLPALVLMWTSLYGYKPPSLGVLPQASFSAYADLLRDDVFQRAVANTFLVAGLSAVIVTLIGAALAWILVRSRLPGRAALDFLSFASIGIPSVIAGLAAMLLYLSLPVGVYGTVWALVLAYSYRLAVTTRLSRAGLMQIHRELEEASYAAGGRWADTIRRVLLPLTAPSLLAGFLLLFIVGFREFTMAFMLMSRDNMVLSVVLWNLFENAEVEQAAAVATLIIVFVAPLIFVKRRRLTPGGAVD